MSVQGYTLFDVEFKPEVTYATTRKDLYSSEGVAVKLPTAFREFHVLGASVSTQMSDDALMYKLSVQSVNGDLHWIYGSADTGYYSAFRHPIALYEPVMYGFRLAVVGDGWDDVDPAVSLLCGLSNGVDPDYRRLQDQIINHMVFRRSVAS